MFIFKKISNYFNIVAILCTIITFYIVLHLTQYSKLLSINTINIKNVTIISSIYNINKHNYYNK